MIYGCFRKCWLHLAIVILYGLIGRTTRKSSVWLCHSFLLPRVGSFSMNGAPKLHPSRLRVLYDEDGIEIPPYHVDDEVIKAQVLHEGPEIPQELWKRPERPVGFVGYKGMASDFRFCKPDRAVMSRMMRRRYKQVIYKHVRATYKKYVRDSRNVAELMYWRMKLDSLPRDSSKTRYNRICMLTGRTRAVYRVVGLTRHQFRDFAYRGLIPGIRRANW